MKKKKSLTDLKNTEIKKRNKMTPGNEITKLFIVLCNNT